MRREGISNRESFLWVQNFLGEWWFSGLNIIRGREFLG